MTTDFRKFWWAGTSSRFGTTLTITAVATAAVELLHADSTQLGVLTAAGYLPACLFGPLGGRAADRTPRPRRLLVRCDLIACLMLAATAVCTALGLLSIGWLIGLELGLGCLAVVIESVYFIHLQTLVPRAELTAARARLQSGEYGASMAGNSVAGALVATVGGAAAFGADALSYALSGLLLRRLRAPDRPAAEPAAEGRDIGDTVRAGLRPPPPGSFARSVVVLLLCQATAGGATTALLAAFLLRDLSLPVGVFGAVFALTGAAGIAGSALASRLTADRDLRTVFLASAAGQVAAAIGLAASVGPPAVAWTVAGGALAVSRAAGAVANVSLSGVIVAETDARLLGRTVAVLRSATTGCQVAGALLAGWAASVIGTRGALWCGALLPLLAVPVLARSRRRPTPGRTPSIPESTPEASMESSEAVR